MTKGLFRTTMRMLCIVAALGFFAIIISGCNTVQGVGEDITSVGEAGEDAMSGD